MLHHFHSWESHRLLRDRYVDILVTTWHAESRTRVRSQMHKADNRDRADAERDILECNPIESSSVSHEARFPGSSSDLSGEPINAGNMEFLHQSHPSIPD